MATKQERGRTAVVAGLGIVVALSVASVAAASWGWGDRIAPLGQMAGASEPQASARGEEDRAVIAGVATSSAGNDDVSSPDVSASARSDGAMSAANAQANELFGSELAEYEEQLAPYRQTVPLGETFGLANIENAPLEVTNWYTGEKITVDMAPFVPWTGTLNVTFLDAKAYDSIEAAQSEVELGTVVDAEPAKGLANPRVLVTHVKVTNVDATPGLGGVKEQLFAAGMFAPRADGGSPTGVTPDMAAFDGVPEGLELPSHDVNKFELAQGETRILTLSWWVSGDDVASLAVRPELSADNPGPITFELVPSSQPAASA